MRSEKFERKNVFVGPDISGKGAVTLAAIDDVTASH